MPPAEGAQPAAELRQASWVTDARRSEAAVAALQGLLTVNGPNLSPQDAARRAVAYADALMKELSK